MAKITKIEQVPPKMLVPYGRNAKKHPAEQIEKLKNSIVAFGFLTPCVIDREYNIIAGHGRVQAAIELGLNAVPCVFVDGLTDEERRAYILVDNRIGELSGWDYEMLDMELDNIQLDMSEFGFSADNIDMNGFFEEAEPQEPKKAKTITCPECGAEFTA